MKFKYGMTEEERSKIVRRSILRNASALYNACKIAYIENKCGGCPFSIRNGCNLYGHPLEWENLLEKVKGAKK